MMRIAILMSAALLAAACEQTPKTASEATASDTAQSSATANASEAQEQTVSADEGGSISAAQDTDAYQAGLLPTQNNKARGTLDLAPEGTGVLITGTITGLTPGAEHGFHVHEKGDCSAPDGSSAGAHFNPTEQPHGHPTQTAAHHVGDMLNLRADAQGIAQVNTVVEGVSLGDGSNTDIAGKALVVHEKADDYSTQPSGDSGGRIACGIIQ